LGRSSSANRRSSLGSLQRSLTIIARTDAAASKGIDGVVARAKLYLSAGADAIFPEVLTSVDMVPAGGTDAGQ
jgi:methylisocitrate lyase